MSGTRLDYTSINTNKWRNLPKPPGFADVTKTSGNTPAQTKSKEESYEALKDKRAWDMAISPAKSLPMNAFMLYMSGNGVQIFSIGILVMLLLNPIKAIASINSAFASFAPKNSDPTAFTTLSLQKLAFIGCNILTMALGIYKCRSMGLIPTGTGDWLAFETRGMAPETLLY
ncbi:hypothetical protein RhiJN_25436 [Ceratobasidium sp. AG-Ba]|nr:hypothetical protein RhiJN_25436 [Ceratobasidium sp. AG-Ba]